MNIYIRGPELAMSSGSKLSQAGFEEDPTRRNRSETRGLFRLPIEDRTRPGSETPCNQALRQRRSVGLVNWLLVRSCRSAIPCIR